MRSVVVLALLVAPVGLAEAHIHMLQPMARQTDNIGNPQKLGHCGDPTMVRTTNRVSTYLPGATITVMWAETIAHVGHYRIAFQPNGDTFHLPPVGGAPGGYPDVDATGTTDPTTGAMVLKDMIADGGSTDITFPNMECTNCTLQFIQVMTGSAPYTPTTGAQDDLYFNCADIVLAANAPDAGTQVNDPDAGVDPGGGGGPNRGNETGGCSAGGGGAGWPALFALLGLVGWRRRQR